MRAAGPFPEFQAVADVLRDVHVRKQCAALEDDIRGPAMGRNRRHVGSTDEDAALAGMLEAGHDPEEGGLAAAARTQERHEFVVVDREIDVV